MNSRQEPFATSVQHYMRIPNLLGCTRVTTNEILIIITAKQKKAITLFLYYRPRTRMPEEDFVGSMQTGF